MSDARRAAEFWDHEVVAHEHIDWMADPQVREYINRSIDREHGQWPLDFFQRHIGGRQFERALSIGCGSGAFERDAIRRDLVRRMIGVDASTQSLAIARDEARKLGYSDRISYAAIDFNRIAFRRLAKFDFVVFHQSAHHVSELERAYAALLDVMADDAILYMDEYIGPSRFEWNRRRMRVIRDIYREIPRGWRTHDELPLPIAAADPSEAIRSSEILPLLKIGFEIEELRGFGGNVLAMVFPDVRWSEVTDRQALVARLIEREKELLDHHAPLHAVIVARPKRGAERIEAIQRYRKAWSRIAFMIRRRTRRSAFPPVTGHQ